MTLSLTVVPEKMREDELTAQRLPQLYDALMALPRGQYLRIDGIANTSERDAIKKRVHTLNSGISPALAEWRWSCRSQYENGQLVLYVEWVKR